MSIVRVIGGVDTHADVHVAAAVDHNGGLLGIESFPTNEAGYESLAGWLAGFGPVTRVGVEGTGSYGVGLARFLTVADVEVVEVDNPGAATAGMGSSEEPFDRWFRERISDIFGLDLAQPGPPLVQTLDASF